jgi:hypothetical protein
LSNHQGLEGGLGGHGGFEDDDDDDGSRHREAGRVGSGKTDQSHKRSLIEAAVYLFGEFQS